MPPNMKNINNFTQLKNGSVDLTFAREITHQKALRAVWVQYAEYSGHFSIHSAYLLTSQSENKKLSWSVWILIK